MPFSHSLTQEQDRMVCDDTVVSGTVLDAALSSAEIENNSNTVALTDLSARKRTCCVVIVAICLLLAAIAVAVVFLTGSSSFDADSATDSAVRSETYYIERYKKFRPVIGRLSSPSALLQPDTPQSQALQWLVDQDTTLSHVTIDETQLTQRYAVLVLFYACGGEQWQGFNVALDKQGSVGTCDLGGGEICMCRENQVIFSLDLSGRRLTGELPDEIALLTNLQTLNLHDNFLKGTIPKTLSTSLSNLEFLILSQNELANTIPSNLGELTGLVTLDLGFNQLSGSLPIQLQRLTSLKYLALKENLVTGPFFEPFLAAMPAMIGLNLDQTLLTGNIPATVIGSLTNLEYFSIESTLFSGNMPTEIGQLSSLIDLIVYGENIGGSLPDLTLLTNLQYLILEGRLHTGSIPTSIGLLTNLREISFRTTSHAGTIPTEIGLARDLEKIIFVSTELTGTIPPEIGNLMKLGTLTIKDNEGIVGSIPETICPRAVTMIITYSCTTECECCKEQCCL